MHLCVVQVLASFVATSTATSIAIVVGYLYDSLPDATLTQLDCAFISWYSGVRWNPWPGPLHALLGQPMATLLATFGLQGFAEGAQTLHSDQEAKQAKERRTRGLEKFVLALSDQQLVTGLAILLAGYINRCSMTLYSFDIVAALAWFSSTTHLSTLSVLRVYLVDHPRVRDWRVIAIVGIFGLVAVSQVMTYSLQDSSVPLQCAFTDFSPSSGLDKLDILSIVVVIVFLGTSYTNRIIRLYSFDPDWSIQEWIVGAVVAAFNLGKTTRNLEWIMIATSGGSKAEQGAACRKLRERRRYIEHTKNLGTKSTRGLTSSRTLLRMHQYVIMI